MLKQTWLSPLCVIIRTLSCHFTSMCVKPPMFQNGRGGALSNRHVYRQPHKFCGRFLLFYVESLAWHVRPSMWRNLRILFWLIQMEKNTGIVNLFWLYMEAFHRPQKVSRWFIMTSLTIKTLYHSDRFKGTKTLGKIILKSLATFLQGQNFTHCICNNCFWSIMHCKHSLEMEPVLSLEVHPQVIHKFDEGQFIYKRK